MTKFDTTAPIAPEAPASLGHSEGDAGTESAPTTMKKRKQKIAALVALLVILALLFAWYLMNRKPLS